MTKYLVTGSTGFIGSRLLGLLNTLECDVRLLARSEVANYETIVCSLGQERIPKHTLESVDTVFHLAGFAHDMQDPSKVADLYRVINVGATVELARLAVENGVKRFVFISSVKAGGALASGKCINESDQNEPEGVYGESKREAELKLLKIGNESGMHMSIIRPSLVYGPDVKGNLQLMLSGIEKGWFPPLPETGNRRSMIHVDDLVRAILLVAEDKRANGEIFIATDGAPYSSREIYDVMCNISGKLTSKWSVPKNLFNLASLASPRIKYKINKLLGDECYSSVKLEELGFKAKKSLKDMNETDF
jgi:nucleoside-diphosphate-sugar epimerase